MIHEQNYLHSYAKSEKLIENEHIVMIQMSELASIQNRFQSTATATIKKEYIFCVYVCNCIVNRITRKEVRPETSSATCANMKQSQKLPMTSPMGIRA